MRGLFLLLFLPLHTMLLSQTAIGLGMDRYSGVDRIFVNPALSLESANSWDFTLGAFHVFVESDYAFIRDTRLLSLFSDLDVTESVIDKWILPIETDNPLLIFDLDEGDKKVSIHSKITGPSFSFKLPNGMSFGAFSSLNVQASSFDIPENIGIYEINESYQTGNFVTSEASFASMLWSEVGVHIAKEFYSFNLGINVRYLMPKESFILRNNLPYSYVVIDEVLEIPYESSSFEFSFTKNLIDENWENIGQKTNGRGIGFDIGARYEVNDYLTVGASIMDLGGAKLTSDVESYYFEHSDEEENIEFDLAKYETVFDGRSLLDSLQKDLSLIPNLQSSNRIGLPTTINVQFDYWINEKFQVSGFVSQRITIPGSIKRDRNTLRGDNIMMLVPRYQKKWFSAALPLTMYEYGKVRVGAAFRLGFFTIGSENLLSVIRDTRFTGTDIYAKFSIFPFLNLKKKNKGPKRNGKIKCYDF